MSKSRGLADAKLAHNMEVYKCRGGKVKVKGRYNIPHSLKQFSVCKHNQRMLLFGGQVTEFMQPSNKLYSFNPGTHVYLVLCEFAHANVCAYA